MNKLKVFWNMALVVALVALSHPNTASADDCQMAGACAVCYIKSSNCAGTCYIWSYACSDGQLGGGDTCSGVACAE